MNVKRITVFNHLRPVMNVLNNLMEKFIHLNTGIDRCECKP